jgi:signal transduction histidine kinase
VADDGKGFDVERGGRTGSYGLLGMRERANAIGARLEIESKPSMGTVVECRVSPVTK